MAETNPYEQFLVEKNPYEQFLKPEKPFKIGKEGFADAMRATIADMNPHPLTQFSVGMQGGVGDVGFRIGQLLGKKLTPEQEQEVRANRVMREELPMATAGGIAGQLALTGKPGASAYKGATDLAAKVLPKSLAPSVGAATSGGLLGYLTDPVLEGESGLENAGRSSLVSTGLDAATRGGARLIQPITQSPAVKSLLSRDIVPTPGQAAGGFIGRTEEKVQSVPFVGDIITNAKNRARTELGTEAINLEMPKGMKVTQAGREGLDQADEKLSEAYKKLYGNTSVTRDAQLVSDLKNAVNAPAIPLSDDYRKMYDKIVKRDVLDRLKTGETFSSASVKAEIEGDLGKAIRGLGFKGQEGALRDALLEARQGVRDLAGRQAGVDQAQRKILDKAYSNVRDMEKAANAAEGSGGLPTPLQISRAAKDGSKLEQLGRDAQSVMGNRVPNSGTTDRALMSLLLGGAGAAASTTDPYQKTPYLNSLGPGFWMGLGASPLLYSRPGSKYMVGGYPGQQSLAAGVRGTAPYTSQVGGLLAQ